MNYPQMDAERTDRNGTLKAIQTTGGDKMRRSMLVE